MFGRPGIAYIYFCYGAHYMLNVVTEKTGVPGAVLIRAAIPVSGIGMMLANRCMDNAEALTDGPGKLTRAFGIDLKYNGVDLTAKSSYLNIYSTAARTDDIRVIRSKRIGLSRGVDQLLRFTIESQH